MKRCGVSLLAPLTLAALLLLATGCSGSLDSDAPDSNPSSSNDGTVAETGDHHSAVETFEDGQQVAERFEGETATFDRQEPFRQVSLMFDTAGAPDLQWRTPESGGWSPVEVTWSDGDAHVGRALLDRPAREIELRTSSELTFLHIGFSLELTARTERPLARDLPKAENVPDQLQHSASGSTAQTDAVVTRSEWGARRPNNRCGRFHDPYRMTIHHTASPSNDGGNPARRLRQIQAFHIDNNGWCDIGYHFVVSQSGEIFEGRRAENRTGAHVGGENTGNLGVALIGNFEVQTVRSTQFRAAAEIVHSIHETYDIPLARDRFKGHTEWPGQGTSCPGKNMLARLDELARESDSGAQTQPANFTGAFRDDDDSIHEKAIDTLADRDVVSGCSSSPPRFCPERSVTRGAFAVMLDASLNLGAASRDYFSDDAGAFYEEAANRLAEAGILKGCGQSAFSRLCGSENLTRAEAAVLLDEAFSFSDSPNDYFRDDEGHWAEDAINDVAAARVASGCSSDSFCPDDETTRGQAATLICRANGWSC